MKAANGYRRFNDLDDALSPFSPNLDAVSDELPGPRGIIASPRLDGKRIFFTGSESGDKADVTASQEPEACSRVTRPSNKQLASKGARKPAHPAKAKVEIVKAKDQIMAGLTTSSRKDDIDPDGERSKRAKKGTPTCPQSQSKNNSQAKSTSNSTLKNLK